jgi:DNA-directed RNA polymerase subunit N (RpoN/RPB10)
MLDHLKFYELPSIRCKNCNKPIAHLFDDFYTLIGNHYSKEEAFQLLELQYCCRKEFFTFKNTTFSYNESKMLDREPNPEKTQQVLSKTITYTNSQCTPCFIKVSPQQKKINDTLYISYASESTYYTH